MTPSALKEIMLFMEPSMLSDFQFFKLVTLLQFWVLENTAISSSPAFIPDGVIPLMP